MPLPNGGMHRVRREIEVPGPLHESLVASHLGKCGRVLRSKPLKKGIAKLDLPAESIREAHDEPVLAERPDANEFVIPA